MKKFHVYKYSLRVKHDAGVIHISTAASSAAAARHIVMEAEHCPRSAIKACLRTGRIV